MTALHLGARAQLGLSSRARHGAPPPPFTPASIAGLAFWYDAAISPTLGAGGAIEQWQDLSGAANHAGQGIAASRPQHAQDDAGHDVVRFDGVDDALLVGSPPDLLSGATTFLVFRVRERSDFAGLLAAGDGVAVDEASHFAFASGAAAGQELQLRARSGEADPLAISGIDSGDVQFAIFTLDDAAGALRDLNGEAGDASTSVPLGTPALLALGARVDGAATSGHAAIDLYEVGLYADVLGPADLDRLETYLRGRYGLAWSPQHLGAHVAWFHDVHDSSFELDGGGVVRWSDLGPAGRDWHQDGAERPTKATDAAGRDTLRFDGDSAFMRLDGTPPALEPFTTAIVCAVRTPGDFAGILSAAPASGADLSEFWTFQSVDGATPALSLEGRALEADPLSLALDDPGSVTLAFWTTEGGAADLETSGEAISDTYDGVFGTPGEIVLGGRFEDAPFGHAAIDVYATLGITRALTAAERQRLIAWAQARWEL